MSPAGVAGNCDAGSGDYPGMECERWRELLSAQLDGEDGPEDRARTDGHLAGCAGCRRWLDAAAKVNRLTRTGTTAAVPDLSAAILAALRPESGLPVSAASLPVSAAGVPVSAAGVPVSAPGVAGSAGGGAASAPGLGGSAGSAPGPRRTGGTGRLPSAAALFVGLAVVGAVQLILGLAQVGAGAALTHPHPAGFAADPSHLWHESAAWNVSVGAGFLVIGLRRIRPTGLVPMLSAFVGMLLLLSVNDLTAGRVDSSRLTSHGFVIVGYLLVLALSRIASEGVRPPGDCRRGGTWRARFDDVEAAAPPPPGLRLVGRGPVTARHDDTRRAA